MKKDNKNSMEMFIAIPWDFLTNNCSVVISMFNVYQLLTILKLNIMFANSILM